MGLKEQAQRRWRKVFDQKQERIKRARGILGNGSGVVVVPDRPDYRYVRLNADDRKVEVVLSHPLVPDINGLTVILKQEPDSPLWELEKVERSTLSNVGSGWNLPLLGTHGKTHEWEDFQPGPDAVSVFPRALTPLRTEPTKTYSMNVVIRPIRYSYEGVSKEYKGGQYSLATYVPGSGQRYVLTYLDIRDGSLKTLIGNPTTYSIALDPTPPLIPWYGKPSALVKLRQNQNIITETDIEDARLVVDDEGIVHNLTAQSVPAVTDDASVGYGPGSLWINRDTSIVYICLSGAIGAADWDQINGGGSGAPADAQYVTLALDGTLSAERVLTAGTGIGLADGGAGGNATLSLDINGLTAETAADDADAIAIYDNTAGALRKQTRANFLTGVRTWPGPGEIRIGTTLYATLEDAYSAAAAGAVILLGPGTYTLSGLLTVAKTITIAGLSARVTTITYGGANHSVLLTESCRLLNVTLASTSTTSTAAALAAAGSGKTFNVDQCVITKTGAAAEGNGVYFAAGTLNIKNSEITASGATTSVAVRNDTVSGAGTCRLSGCRISGTTWDIYSDQTGTTITLEDTVLVNNTVSVVAGVLGGSYQAATTGDLYPAGDNAGVDQRRRSWLTVTDDFRTFSGWTWASNLHFDGTPANVSVATFPSVLQLYNDDVAEEFFAYVAASGSTTEATIRAARTGGTYVGVRIDDGGAGTENSFELRLLSGSAAPFYRLQWVAVTAGAPTTGYYADLMPPGFYIVRILRQAIATWAGFGYVTKDAPLPTYIGATVAGQTWTPARVGFTFGFSLNSNDRGLIDSIRIA